MLDGGGETFKYPFSTDSREAGEQRQNEKSSKCRSVCNEFDSTSDGDVGGDAMTRGKCKMRMRVVS